MVGSITSNPNRRRLLLAIHSPGWGGNANFVNLKALLFGCKFELDLLRPAGQLHVLGRDQLVIVQDLDGTFRLVYPGDRMTRFTLVGAWLGTARRT